MEIFKTIEFRGKTMTISNKGTLLTTLGKPRKLHKNSSGYLCYTSDKLYLVHRIVATAFCQNDDPTNKTCVNHIDGNKLNNNATNLEWVTRSENDLHKFRVLGHRPSIKGLKENWLNPIHCKPILAYDINMNLIHEFKSGFEAAKFLNVGPSAISNCVNKKSSTCKGYILQYKHD